MADFLRRRANGPVLEQFGYGDWGAGWADMLSRFSARQDGFWPMAALASWERRKGFDYPFYMNETEHGLLRAQSRILCGTSTYAHGLLEGLLSYTLGDGLTYRWVARAGADEETAKPIAAALQRVTDAHQKRNQWRGGEQPGMEEEFFRRSVRDGETFLVHTANEDGTTDHRFAEPDMVRKPLGATDEEWSFGIQVPVEPVADVSTHKAFNICWDYQHANGVKYTPDRVTFFRRNADRNVKRGIPDFVFAGHESLDAAEKLRRALGAGATIQACLAGIRQHDAIGRDSVESFVKADATFKQANFITGLLENVAHFRPGEVWDIPKGMNFVDPPGAKNAPAHVQVLDVLLRAGGRPWNAPEWLVSGDSSNTVFASSLTAESPFVVRVKREQRAYCEVLGTPVRFAVRHWCKARGLRAGDRTYTWDEVDQLVELTVTAPSPVARDRDKEAQRDKTYVDMGAKSVQMVVEEQGYDFHRVEKDRREYEALHPPQAGGLPGGGAPPGQVPVGQAPDAGGAEGEFDLPGGMSEDIEFDDATLLEADWLKSGTQNFTGVITTADGRRRRYENGKEVPLNPGGAQPAAPSGKPAGQPAGKSARVPTEHDLGRLNAAVRNATSREEERYLIKLRDAVEGAKDSGKAVRVPHVHLPPELEKHVAAEVQSAGHPLNPPRQSGGTYKQTPSGLPIPRPGQPARVPALADVARYEARVKAAKTPAEMRQAIHWLDLIRRAARERHALPLKGQATRESWLREGEDSSGHMHDDAGRFSATGGHAATARKAHDLYAGAAGNVKVREHVAALVTELERMPGAAVVQIARDMQLRSPKTKAEAIRAIAAKIIDRRGAFARVSESAIRRMVRSVLREDWDPRKHPRDRKGLYIPVIELSQAKLDPAKADELRARVRPQDRKALERRINPAAGTNAALKRDAAKQIAAKLAAPSQAAPTALQVARLKDEAQRLAAEVHTHRQSPGEADQYDAHHKGERLDLLNQQIATAEKRLGVAPSGPIVPTAPGNVTGGSTATPVIHPDVLKAQLAAAEKSGNVKLADAIRSMLPTEPKPAAPLHPRIPVLIRGPLAHNPRIRQLGGRWDADRGAWVVNQEAAKTLKAEKLPGLTFTLPREVVNFYHPERRESVEEQDGTLLESGWEGLAEAEVVECGGEGGRPGPCPEPGDDDAGIGGKLHAALTAVVTHLHAQYAELAGAYGRTGAIAILGVAALPIPGTALAPLAAKVLARAVAAIRAHYAAEPDAKLEAVSDLAPAVEIVKRLILLAHEQTGEPAPMIDDDAIRAAVQQALAG